MTTGHWRANIVQTRASGVEAQQGWRVRTRPLFFIAHKCDRKKDKERSNVAAKHKPKKIKATKGR